MKPIGVVVIEYESMQAKIAVPIYNPGVDQKECPLSYIELEEPILEKHLDATRSAIVVRSGGFMRVTVQKETRNNEVVFMIKNQKRDYWHEEALLFDISQHG